MKVQRGQHGSVNDCWDLIQSDGQHGIGIYTFPYGDKNMQEYYTRQGENLYTIEIPDHLVLDVSHTDADYWDARQIIYNDIQHAAFIFKHQGPGIPTSKEIVITDADIITNITLCKKKSALLRSSNTKLTY